VTPTNGQNHANNLETRRVVPGVIHTMSWNLKTAHTYNASLYVCVSLSNPCDLRQTRTRSSRCVRWHILTHSHTHTHIHTRNLSLLNGWANVHGHITTLRTGFWRWTLTGENCTYLRRFCLFWRIIKTNVWCCKEIWVCIYIWLCTNKLIFSSSDLT